MIAPCNLAPQQKIVIQSRSPFIFIYGGVGTFKTSGGLLRIYLHCQMYPGSKILVMAKTLDQIRNIYLDEWRRQIPQSEYSYLESKNTIRLHKSKSKIILVYTDNPKAEDIILGTTISGYHMIQAETIKRETYFLKLEQRIRLFGPEPHDAYLRIIDANPGIPGHWVHQFLIDKKHERYLDPKLVHRIQCRTRPHTSSYSAETIERWCKKYPGWLYQRMVDGEWTYAEGRVWEQYQIFDHPADRMKQFAAEFDRIFIGCDPAHTNPTALVLIGFKADKYYIFDEIRETKLTVGHLWKILKVKLIGWGIETLKLRMWVDPAAAGWVGEWNALIDEDNKNYVSRYVYAYKSTHKGTDPVLNRAIKLREMFVWERLVISNLCKYVIQDCERTTFKPEHAKEVIDKDAYDPHSMDAVGYVMTQEAF